MVGIRTSRIDKPLGLGRQATYISQPKILNFYNFRRVTLCKFCRHLSKRLHVATGDNPLERRAYAFQ
jgi:hypothetical protein